MKLFEKSTKYERWLYVAWLLVSAFLIWSIGEFFIPEMRIRLNDDIAYMMSSLSGYVVVSVIWVTVPAWFYLLFKGYWLRLVVFSSIILFTAFLTLVSVYLTAITSF